MFLSFATNLQCLIGSECGDPTGFATDNLYVNLAFTCIWQLLLCCYHTLTPWYGNYFDQHIVIILCQMKITFKSLTPTEMVVFIPTLVRETVWYSQTKNNYLRQSWARSISSFGIIRPQTVTWYKQEGWNCLLRRRYVWLFSSPKYINVETLSSILPCTYFFRYSIVILYGRTFNHMLVLNYDINIKVYDMDI